MSWLPILTLLSILLSLAEPLPWRIGTTLPARADLLTAQNNRVPNSELKIPAGGVGNLVKELNLSADQIQRLQQVRKNSQGKTKERRQSLQTAKQELTKLLQGNASSDQVRQKRQQVQSLQKEVADSNFENTLAIREILTSEQRVKLQQLLQQRRQNRQKS